MFKVNNKTTKTTPMALVLVSIVNFEQVNAGWDFCTSSMEHWNELV